MTHLSSRLALGIILTLISSLIEDKIVLAQIIPDNSLGSENSRTRPDIIKNTPSDVIEGGATRGSNLFHSFREFSIKEGRGAYFANPEAIQNIFTRVTGGNISHILGTLGVLGNGNLYLINPSGIIFGPNARLDMRGAFIGSTADSLVFDNNFEFSATNPDAPPLLTVNIPIGLRFREKSGDINSTANLITPGNLSLKAENLTLSGSLVTGGDLSLEALKTLIIRDSVISPFIAASGGNLRLQGNQNVDIYTLNHPGSGIIAGKDLVLRSANAVSGDAHFWSGGSFRIEKLDGNLGGLVSLYDPIIRTGGDVLIGAYNGASLHIIAGGKVEIPGYILITGTDAQFGLVETITLSDGQQITIDGKSNPTVDIRAGVSPEFIGTPFFQGSGLDFFDQPQNFPITATSADINVGIIFIGIASQEKITGDVLLTNQYHPNPNLQGSIKTESTQLGFAAIKTGLIGDGGRVTIDSKANINIKGDINSTSLNTGGNILLNSVGDTSITYSTIGVTGSQGGNIQINANNINLNIITLSALNGGNIFLNSVGDTLITTGRIEVTGSQGGNININANKINLTNTLLLAGIGKDLGFENAQSGDITLNAIQDIILDSSLIANFVQQEGTGNIGNVIINTSNFTLKNGSSLESTTLGNGDAGAIKVNATDSITLSGESSSLGASGIFSRVETTGNGDSRGIVINTSSLALENGANIDSSTFGVGNAGVIQINATESINITGETSLKGVIQSGIVSQVTSSGIGNSEGIVINTSNLTLQDGGIIDASTLGKGNAGAVQITANDSIKLTGESTSGKVSKISSQVQVGIDGEGNSGGININTSTLTLEHGGGIYASTLGKGDAGGISINATDSINITGESLQIKDKVVSGIFSDVNQDGKEKGIGDSKGIIINTSTLTIQEGGRISASTFSLGNAGAIQITANDSITITGESLSGFNSNISSQVAETTAEGNSGGIEITTGTLSLIDGGQVTTNTFGKGDAGAIQITASDTIFAIGAGNQKNISSGITSIVNPDANGNSGGIEITTGALSLLDGANVNASTLGMGDAGAIKIKARDTISAIGESSKNNLSGIYSLVTDKANGNSGGIEITTGTLSLMNGANVNAGTGATGNAGTVKITARDTISITGENSQGFVSVISSIVGSKGVGNSEGIEINTGSLFINDGAAVTASTRGVGNAGDIKITANDTISAVGKSSQSDRSGIYSIVEIFNNQPAVGNAGEIQINTATLSLTDGAQINARTSGMGNASNILIKEANSITLTGGSQLKTDTSSQGNSGSVIINSPNAVITFDGVAFINGELSPSGIVTVVQPVDGLTEARTGGDINVTAKSLSLTNGAQLNALTEGLGNAGNVSVNINDTITVDGNFSGILTQVAQDAIGKGGNINITADSLSLSNGAQIASDTFGFGDAGNINLDIRGQITLKDFVTIPTDFGILPVSSSIATGVQIEGIGNAGIITIKAQSLSLDNFSLITTATSGQGNAADISIQVDDFLTLTNLSTIESIVGAGAIGNSGNITLKARSLTLTNGSQIGTQLSRSQGSQLGGVGIAGNININVTDLVNISGVSQVQLPIAPILFPTEGFSSGLFASSEKGASGAGGTITLTTNALYLADGAVINTLSANEGKAGDITINANTFSSTGGGQVIAITRNSGNAGTITLNIADNMLLSGSDPTFADRFARFGEDIVNNQGAESGLFAQTSGQGSAGNIIINTPIFNIADSAVVSARTSGSGNGGSITVNSPIYITLGEKSQLNVETSGAGQAGNIEITSNTVTIGKDAQISATATQDATNISGGGSININASNLNIAGELGIFAETKGQAPAGTLTLNPDNTNPNLNILFIEQGLISASTSASGQGGDINISAPNNIDIRGIGAIATETSGSGNAGTIKLNSNQLTLAEGVEITASTTIGTGNAGDITLNASQINLQSAKINAFTDGMGNAGSIKLSFQENNAQTINLDNSEISTEIKEQGIATQLSNITIISDTLNLANSSITASTAGTGNAGDITLTNSQLNINNSSISAKSTGIGNAGSITVPNAQNINLNQSEITASTSGEGNTGTIDLTGTARIELNNNSEISNAVEAKGVGNAQTITLITPELSLQNSRITSSTDGIGNAGSISVPNAHKINLDNSIISTEIKKDGVANQPSNITLTSDTLNLNNSNITTSTAGIGNAGEITLINQQFNLDNSKITATSEGVGNAGSINLPNTQNLSLNQSEISVSTTQKGDAGSITVSNAQNINLNQSRITASTSGEGDTGTIELTGTEKIELNNNSTISNAVEAGGIGNAQTITLNTPNLTLENQSVLSSATAGIGDAGSIIIPNAQTISLDNSIISTAIAPTGNAIQPSNITIQTQQLNLNNNSQITATTSGFGDAGKISITANSLTSTNGASIQTNTTSSGKAGDIVFQLQDHLTLINSTVEASTAPNSTGDGGNITIDPRTVTLTDGARISVNNQGQGDGGNISLFAQNLTLQNRSEISATTASGEGGNITLNVPNTINQRNNSPISATAGGTGNGGNVTLTTKFLIGNNNSNITANAYSGTGGNINITADGIFRGSNSKITASSQLGIDGVVKTDTPEVDPSRGLINLPQNIIDPNALISQNACRQGGKSEFTVRGRGGLPSTPEQVQSSNEVEVGLVGATALESTKIPVSSTITTRKIIPAQGWMRNAKGEMILVAYPTANGTNRQINSPVTCSSN